MGRRLYLVAGEHSGDSRGAELIAALRERRPDWEFRGLGGAKMRSLAGPGMRDWVEEAGVVGIWEVLKRYRWFKAQFARALGEIRQLAPDAVVLVDYPGFNLRLARALREARTKASLIDYISPQVWAWNRGRIPQIARCLDLMLCLFHFEQDLFREAGLRTVCVGHPMIDQLEAARITGGREGDLVGLFPGSREREVARLFPVMLEAVRRLHRSHPAWAFEAAAASERLAAAMRAMLGSSGGPPVGIVTGRSCELMQRARCGLVASGTATLEATYYGLPYCLVYKVSWPTYLASRIVMDLDHIGIANILAGREIVHEFLQHEANPGNLAAFVESVMTDRVRRRELEQNLLETARLLGDRGAARRAAAAIVELLEDHGG